jgi:hypothetical protein
MWETGAMKVFSILTGAAILLGSTTMASATGTLAISAVAHPGPSQLKVSGTCVQGAGPVKILVKKVTSGAWTNLATLGGTCGLNAATAGKTVTINAGGLVPGMYKVRLKQGGAFSAPSSSIALP